MDKLRRALSGDEPESEEQGIAAQFRDATTLAWSTRIQGFAICFILGFIFSIIGTALIALPRGLIIFAMLYTIGNIMSIASTMFLMGPWKQLKKMFNETRVLATIGVIVFMILTLVAALYKRSVVLSLIFCICQFLAFTWYSLSYIPYARDVVRKTLTSCV